MRYTAVALAISAGLAVTTPVTAADAFVAPPVPAQVSDLSPKAGAKTQLAFSPTPPDPLPVVTIVAQPKPKPKPRPTPSVSRSVIRRTTAVNWDAIAKCESGGHWNHHSATAGLYWGGLQMDMTFWHSYHGDRFAARPDLATKAQQIAVAERAYRSRGLEPWPTCGRYG